MNDAQPGRRLGKAMMLLAWLAGIGLATHFFGLWEKRQHNPNVQPQSLHGDGLARPKRDDLGDRPALHPGLFDVGVARLAGRWPRRA